ncbi:hypothetical protein CORC01_01293 [Colletotrichum orchidophilum]|uniref:Secreted protein n=1 Tax=Colletotrichum orchidophilum TaxID=1209926 RepID=A0A1G4BQ66_9PEZI|nr:uncharacterized protein CORC01_01293 [Colletotrichum orchidophilum]OHF03574.1 hypothetical protein CORC01_01293 [Colletotrichum orchidophilum]
MDHLFWLAIFVFIASTVQKEHGFTHAVLHQSSFQACSAISPIGQCYKAFPSNCFSSTVIASPLLHASVAATPTIYTRRCSPP